MSPPPWEVLPSDLIDDEVTEAMSPSAASDNASKAKLEAEEDETLAAIARDAACSSPTLAPESDAIELLSSDDVAAQDARAVQASLPLFDPRIRPGRARLTRRRRATATPAPRLALSLADGDRALRAGDLHAVFERSLALQPGYLPARLGLADALWDAGRRDAAAEHYREIRARFANEIHPTRVIERTR